MKNPALISCLSALGGFLLAWLLKSNSPSTTTEIPPPRSAAPPKTLSTSARSTSREKKQHFDPSTHTPDGVALPPEIIAARESMTSSLNQSFETKDQGFIQRLAELLQLDASQQQQLLQLLQSKRSALNLFQPAPGANPQNMADEAARVEKNYHDSLAQILTSDQIKKLNQFHKQQAENRKLAQTQKEYADLLEKIDLSPDQQSQVLQALQPLQESQPAEPSASEFFRETYDVLGFGVAGDAISQQVAANAYLQAHQNPEQAIQELTSARQDATTRKIEALRPILSPAQLSQYSALLQARDQAYFANLAPMLPIPSVLPPEE